MNSRREVRQLAAGDQFAVSLTLHLELVETTKQDGGTVRLQAKVVPCGTGCGAECECGSRVFQACEGPFEFVLKGSQRVPYYGNLQQLLADSQRIQQQIARLAGADAQTGATAVSKGKEAAHAVPVP